MGKTKNISVSSFARIMPLEKLNDEFALCKVYVHGLGKNRNYSYIGKEPTENALPTLSYVPVVGHLIPKFDEDGKVIGHYLGGHDCEIDWDTWEFKPLTVPYGVVVEDSFAYETVEEYGEQVEYLTANAILWIGRYPDLKDAIYSDEVWFNESMEIVPIQTRPLKEDSNYTEILEFSYSALCLLGLSDNPDEHTEPCFISSQVQPVDYSFDKAEFSQMLGELKSQLSFYLNTDFSKEGGASMTDEKIAEIFAEYEIAREDVDFEITEEMSDEELREAIDAFKCGGGNDDKKKDEEMDDPEKDLKDDPDCDPEDDVECNSLKSQLATMQAELESLRAFKAERLEADRKMEYDSAIEEFSDLIGDEEFENIRQNIYSYETVDALLKECYAIRGKKVQVTFSVKPKKGQNKIVISQSEEDEAPYGGFFNKY